VFPISAGKKVGMGGFLYHDMLCNVIQKLTKTK